MPDVPVVDLVVEKNELVIATTGAASGCWTTSRRCARPRRAWPWPPRKLFTPPVAVRSGPDVTLSLVAEGARRRRAKLEVLDSAGAVLRTFVPDTTTARHDRAAGRRAGRRFGGGPWLPTDAGLNTLRWDLRAEPYVTFPGMIFWGARASGPAVPPGRYTVRLTADGHTVTAPLTVERNPWITDVTDADLHAQYEFSRWCATR